MNKFIIIEGLDKTGKSTLAQFLSEKTGMPIKKFSAPEAGEDPYTQYEDFFLQNKEGIIDRCHLSEMAYGPVFRGKSSINEGKQYLLEEWLLMTGVVGVYCEAEKEVLVKRFEEDGEDFIKPEQIEAVQEGFEKALTTSRIPWLCYSVGDDMEAIHEQIRRAL